MSFSKLIFCIILIIFIRYNFKLYFLKYKCNFTIVLNIGPNRRFNREPTSISIWLYGEDKRRNSQKTENNITSMDQEAKPRTNLVKPI